MATTVWKGHLTFGLVSIPVKLYRAARAEKVSFRQLHAGAGTRVRQVLVADAPPEPEPEAENVSALRSAGSRPIRAAEPFVAPAAGRAPERQPMRAPEREVEPDLEPVRREVSRSEIVKGYEYERDQYVTLSREELEAITPQTAHEMEIVEFVQLTEIDPIYYETSYYVSPDKGGERAYSLLFAALRQSGLSGVAQVAMQKREHVVILRPGRTGIVLHTMFYETEVRRADEYRADTAAVAQRELDLALLLIKNLTAPFEPDKYRDTYREKLDALIQAKISGDETVQTPAAKIAPVVNILEALQRSLAASPAPKPKPPVAETAPPKAAPKSGGRRRT